MSRFRQDHFQLAVALSCSVAVLSLRPEPALAKKSPMCMTAVCTDLGGNQTQPMVQILSGLGLHHPVVVPIFWDSFWSTNTTNRNKVVGAVQGVLNGPYLGGAGQYGLYGANAQIGPARMVPTAPVLPGSPSGGMTGVRNAINSAIGSGTVPGPYQYTEMLYVVFIPPGAFSGFSGRGANTVLTCDATCGATFNGKSYSAAWVGSQNTTFSVNDYSYIFGHELVEAVTANVKLANCKSTSGPALDQVADICDCDSTKAQQLGMDYAAYWSQADGACVIPDGWSKVYQYGGAGTWTSIYAGNVRQVYAGGYGLVATDTSDNIMKYSGSGSSWTQIGNQGAMFAVGNGVGTNTIMNITPDASQMWRYTGTPMSWTQVNGPASAVYGGVQMLSTDFSGGSKKYDGTGMSWTWIANTPAQFAVTGNGGIYALGWDTNVWKYGGTPGSWSQVGSAASELFAGGDIHLAMTKLAALQEAYFYQGTPSSWYRQFPPGTSFAIPAFSTFYFLDSARSTISITNNPNLQDPNWTTIGSGAAFRLIGGGNGLWAVGPPAY